MSEFTEIRVSFPVPLVQAIGQYLLTRPMGEVRTLVEAMEREGKEVEVRPSLDPA